MTAQLEMFAPAKEDVNVVFLASHLREHPGWHTAQELLEGWQLPDTESNRRLIRALASQATPDVISGQKGYKHVQHATPDEVHHCASWFESQAKEMAERAQAIRRRAHQLVG